MKSFGGPSHITCSEGEVIGEDVALFWALPIPDTISAIGLDWKLSHVASNCKFEGLLFQVSKSGLEMQKLDEVKGMNPAFKLNCNFYLKSPRTMWKSLQMQKKYKLCFG